MRNKQYNEDVELPEGVQASYASGTLTVKGKVGEVSKDMSHPHVKVRIADGKINFSVENGTSREKKILYTFKSHATNMIKGASEGHKYTLKICSGHFPMNVNISGDKLVVNNFLGESVPRTLKIKTGVKAKVDGSQIALEGVDKGLVGQVAGDIEQLCRITNRDRRIFQDGIYIINKDGKEIK